MKQPFLKGLLFLAFIFLALFIRAQGNYLNVQLFPQEHTQWCWAASMQMLFDFHSTTPVTQCELGIRYQEILKRKTSTIAHSASRFSTCCNTNCSGSTSTTNFCNETIGFSKRGGRVDLHFFDLVLSSYGFSSIEDINTGWMNSVNIRKEIDSCRPFALFLNKVTSTSPFPYNHVVIAKGYLQQGTSEYILVNDPQTTFPCTGCESLLPISVFTAPTTDLNSVLEIVRFIHPKDSSVCETCTDLIPIEENSLVSTIQEYSNSDLFFGIDNNTISKEEFSSYLIDRVEGNLKYFRSKKTYSDLSGSTSSYTLLMSNLTSPKLVVTLKERENDFEIKSVSFTNCTAITPFIITRRNLGNREVRDTFNSDQYEIVEFLPDYFQFYKVNIESKDFLTPTREYEGLSFKPEYLYGEKEVIKRLQNIVEEREELYTDKEEKKKKKCFLLRLFKNKEKN